MDNIFLPSYQNNIIKNAVTSSLLNIFPIEHKGRKLLIKNISAEDDLNDQDFPQQREIKISRKTWHYPIYADLELVDSETGKVISNAQKVKLASIPKVTNRYTTIIDGNEYQTVNQLRRKAGVYSRIKKNGELESEFNLSKGLNFKMQLDPTSQMFSITLAGRNYRYKLWPLLNILGVADTEIAKFWGQRLLDVNKRGSINTEASEMTSLYKLILRRDPKNFEEVTKGLKDYFNNNTELNSEITKITLGEALDKVNDRTLLKASKKLLEINKGNEKPDDRDSLIFKKMLSVDDLLIEHFDKTKASVEAKVKRNLELRDNIREILPSNTFTKPIKDFFTVGDLTSTPPQTNPVTIATDWRKTTPMGTGGIQSGHAITMETRDVQPTHLGFLDPLSTPESLKVGVSVGLASETYKKGTDIATPVYDAKDNLVFINPMEFYNHKVAYPDQFEWKNKVKPRNKIVNATYKGKPIRIDAKEVDFWIRSPRTMFSFATNLVPFLPNVQGNRASTGGRMITQALPIDQKEEPLVQTMRDDVKTYEYTLGSYLSPMLPDSLDGKERTGVVTKVDENYIHIKVGDKIEKVGLYKNFPLNQDGYLDSVPLVQEGDKVNSSVPLAETNYATRKGNLALGKNLSVAYMSYKGYNFEDGAVITESAAKKLSHTMLHRVNDFFSPRTSVFDIKKFKSWYPDILDPKNANKLDERGLPKIGKVFQPGEVILAYLNEKELDDAERALRKLDKFTFSQYVKVTKEWDEDEPGIVTDVKVNGRNIDIYVKSTHPFKEGDKLSGRYGNKYIVTKIIPDSKAPHRKDGTAVDIMLNPHGVPGRMNVGQLLETAASKIAKKTGKPYIVNNFGDPNVDMSKKILDEMKKHRIEPNETLYDGKNGNPFEKPIFVGDQYFLKLRHIVKKKQGVHSYGTYDVDEAPAGKGAQSVGVLDTYSYLAHGAKENLREIGEIKGRRNDEYWRNIQFGLPPGKPNRNFIFNKMLAYLQGLGINTEKEGNQIRIFPMTDADVEKMSNGNIPDPGAMLQGKNLATRKGGLFDQNVTGGLRGTKWSHIDLSIRIPNPTFEQTIKKILDLSEKEYSNIMMGKSKLDEKTGPDAIINRLQNLDVQRELSRLKDELKVAPKTNINKLNTKIRYLEALKNLNLSPVEAYTMSKVPVLPPEFRPIYPLPSGDLMTSDVNKHYRDIGVINGGLAKALERDDVPEDDLLMAKNSLYTSVKAMQGFIDPVNYAGEKYKGLLVELGDLKKGLIHGKAWSKRQDMSARSTITVEPTLGLDEVGIPREMAYKMFKPLIIREMKESGMKASVALKEYESESPLAMRSMQTVLAQRPVILNRAPSLHKHSIQAFKPVIMEGKTIRLNPLIVSGFNADFDGDTMSVMAPIGKEAVEEARHMFPSQILYKHGDNSLVPSLGQEYLFGLYMLSKIDKKTSKKFASIEEAKEAGIPWTHQFDLNGKMITIGQYMINSELPEELRDYARIMDGRTVGELLDRIGKNYKRPVFRDVIDSWKNVGSMYAYLRGNTFSITDLAIDRGFRDKILKKELPKIEAMEDPAERAKARRLLTNIIQKEQDRRLVGTGNGVYEMIESGSISPKKAGNVRQILTVPGVFEDTSGTPIDTFFGRGYAEGLNTSDYFNSLYAVRKGVVDRSVNTQESGALNKSLLNVNRRLIITKDDCGTHKGIEFDLDDANNILGRSAAESIPNVLRKNDIIDSAKILDAKRAGIKIIKVRSPLTCEAPDGLCQLCYGVMPHGQLPSIGTNIGILESQAITERACVNSQSLLILRSLKNCHQIMTLEQLFEKYSYKEIYKGGEANDTEFINLSEENLEVWDGYNWTKLKKVGRHIPAAQMVLVKTKNHGYIVCQNNHPMPIYESNFKCKHCGKWLYKSRTKIINNKKVVDCYYCNKRQEYPGEGWSNNWVKKSPKDVLLRVDGVMTGLNIYDEIRNIGNYEKLPLTNYWFGFYIAEGSINYGKDRQGNPRQVGIRITQIPNDNMENLSKVHPNYNVKVNTKGQEPSVSYNINNKTLAKQVETISGRYSHEKHLPSDFINYENNKLIEILAGLIDGDGFFNSQAKHFVISSNSYHLHQQLQIICHLLGGSSSITADYDNGMMGHQGYKTVLRLDSAIIEKLSEHSSKVNTYKDQTTLYNNQMINEVSPITLVRSVKYEHPFVYDVETDSTLCQYGANSNKNTQLTMQTFHSGGAGGTGITAGFPRLEQLLKVPEKLAGKATLSTVTGEVKQIRRNETGGHVIKIEDFNNKHETNFTIGPGRKVLVSIGSKVSTGDPLSDGILKPQELSELKSHLDAQRYLVRESAAIYGGKFHDKTFETVIRGISDNAEVLDAPDDSGFLRGDKSSVSYIEALNKQRKRKGLGEIKYHPYFKTIDLSNADVEDWLTNITTNRVKAALATGASKGMYANVKGKDPIPAYIYGDNFGRNTNYERGEFF